MLNLVDLSGSEKLDSNYDEVIKETNNINKSLSVLVRVINQLASNNSFNHKNSKNHISYRDSKLTRILS